MTTEAQLFYLMPIPGDWRHWQIENDHKPNYTVSKCTVLRHRNHFGFVIITEHWNQSSIAWEERQAAAAGMEKL